MVTVRKSAQQRSLGRIVFRALGSTVTICAVAIIVALWRGDRLRLDEARVVLSEYWTLPVIVFCGVVTWDFWFAKTKSAEPLEEGGPDQGKGPTSR